jgi:hypothetical protein
MSALLAVTVSPIVSWSLCLATRWFVAFVVWK